MSAFFYSLEPKDWVTLLASFGAIVLSILSFRQKAADLQLAKRKQLTDLLEKITELNMERARYELRKSEYPEVYGGLMADQRRFLARQAAFLMSSISRLVTPFEYQLVAASFGDLGDSHEAERLFELAVSVSVAPFDRGIAARRYAAYLFDQVLPVEGRERFEEALKYFEGRSDAAKEYRADTYLRWSKFESVWSPPRSLELLEKAAAESGAIRHPGKHEWWANRLRRQQDDWKAAHAEGPAGPPHIPTGDPR